MTDKPASLTTTRRRVLTELAEEQDYARNGGQLIGWLDYGERSAGGPSYPTILALYRLGYVNASKDHAGEPKRRGQVWITEAGRRAIGK